MTYTTKQFKQDINGLLDSLRQQVATDSGEWSVRGFIDVYQRIYPVTADTKVLSKLLELMLFPILRDFAIKQGFEVALAEHQNHYPDLSLTGHGSRFALDIKTTYRTDHNRVNGMTLGSFTGYFRERKSTKNITFPYDSFTEHFVLGIIYSGVETPDDSRVYSLDQLASIPTVARDFELFVQEKFRIASDRPGSGNTTNIGSVTQLSALVNGDGPFSGLGHEVFSDYWMFYLTNDMARRAELPHPPYHNLKEYLAYRGKL